jgi:AraC-like DNA-binding protein
MDEILVIDPSVGLPSVLAVALEPHCAVESATTVLETMRRLGACPVRVVVANGGGASLDGRAAIRLVRARLPGCPIVAVDVPEDERLLHELVTLGVERILPAPLSIGDLVDDLIGILGLESRWHMPAPRLAPAVSRALAYVARHFDGNVTVVRIGRAVGVSPSHLAHQFTATTGIAVKEYVTRVRVDATKRGLATSSANLDDLAARCGFCDASHLSRTFRRYTGQWPGTYRRALERARGGPQTHPTTPHARSLRGTPGRGEDGDADD